MNPYPFFTELVLRLQLESPRFFKKLQKIFYVLAAIAQLFVGLKDVGFVFPPELANSLSQSSAVVLFLAGVLSTLPVNDPAQLQQKLAQKGEN